MQIRLFARKKSVKWQSFMPARFRWLTLLLQQAMLETVEQELLDRLAAAVREAPMGTRERPFAMLLPCYRFFAEEAEMATVLMGAYGDSGFFRRAAKIIKARSLSDWKALFPELTPQEMEYLFAFIFGGSLHMLEGWVTSG